MTRALALLLLLALPAAAQPSGTIEFQPEPAEAALEGPAPPPEAAPRAFPLQFLAEPLPVSMDAPAAPPAEAPRPIQLTQQPAPSAEEAALPSAPAAPPAEAPRPVQLTRQPAPSADEAALPSAPAAAPPAPPELSPRPARAPARMAPPSPIPLPPGLEALPNGGLRIRAATLDGATRAALVDYGRRLRALERGRLSIYAEVSGPAEDAHTARRLSLARALAAKDALVEGGLDATRIDLRPLGRTAAGMDRLDVLPPGVDRSDSPR